MTLRAVVKMRVLSNVIWRIKSLYKKLKVTRMHIFFIKTWTLGLLQKMLLSPWMVHTGVSSEGISTFKSLGEALEKTQDRELWGRGEGRV